MVAVQTGANSGAVIDKLGGSGILLTQLLAAHEGNSAVISFSDAVTIHQGFTGDAGPVSRALQMLRKEGEAISATIYSQAEDKRRSKTRKGTNQGE